MSSRTARFFMDPSLIPPRPTNPKEAAAWDAQYGGQLDDTPLFQTPPRGLTVAALPTPDPAERAELA